MMTDEKTMSDAGGPAMVILGAVFMGTSNVALGAAFLAIGSALITKRKKSDDAS